MELIDFIRRNYPSAWLLTYRPFAEMQTSTETASVLTQAVNHWGWCTGYLNLDKSCLQLTLKPDSSVSLSDCPAESMEALIEDFFSRCESSTLIAYTPHFADSILASVTWSAEDLATVLNHNLLVIRDSRNFTQNSLPAPDKLSLELVYGLVLSLRPESRSIPTLRSLAVTVPFLTVEAMQLHIHQQSPTQRKVGRVCDKVLSSSIWMEKLRCIPGAEAALKLESYSALEELLHKTLADAQRHKQARLAEGSASSGPMIGASMRKKVQSLLRQLQGIKRRKEDIWKIQSDVKTMKCGIDADYRKSSADLDCTLLKALAQALVAIKTNIQIANMSTLRDPKKHFLWAFLEERAGVQDAEAVLRAEMDKLADMAHRLKRHKLYKADWKNNVVSMWTVRRRQLMDDFKVAPFEFGPACPELALDLFPDAHAFSFTYGRCQGFGLLLGYRNSFEWLLKYANGSLKNFFIHLIANCSTLSYAGDFGRALASLPDALRTIAATVASGQAELQNSLLDMLDTWLQSDQALNTPVGEMCRVHVQNIFDKLPERLQQKVREVNGGDRIKFCSVVALFDCFCKVFDGPAARWAYLNTNKSAVDSAPSLA